MQDDGQMLAMFYCIYVLQKLHFYGPKTRTQTRVLGTKPGPEPRFSIFRVSGRSIPVILSVLRVEKSVQALHFQNLHRQSFQNLYQLLW